MAAASEADLVRRVEAACLNGWPSLREVVLDTAVLRLSEGHTRRSNSASFLAPPTREPDDLVESCAAVYRAQGQPAIFRLSSAVPHGLDGALDRAGFAAPEAVSRVLHRALLDLPASEAEPRASVIRDRPAPIWLDALARIQRQDARGRSAGERILAALAVPAAFASVTVDDTVAAVAFAAVTDGVACINAVATDPAFRRRGLAGQTIRTLLRWARDGQGAEHACLPVEAGNTGARALYRGLGFDREISRYGYRAKTLGPGA